MAFVIDVRVAPVHPFRLMNLPEHIQQAIKAELINLHNDLSYDLKPAQRINIYNAIGVSALPSFKKSKRYLKDLPNLTKADRIRTRIALTTAKKVLPLWEQACRETDEATAHKVNIELVKEQKKHQETYLNQKNSQLIEEISVYDVPRSHIPLHILEMAEKAFHGNVQDVRKFIKQSNEWWQIYTTPEWCEREFFIKWAVQEALYESVGLVDYNRISPARDAANAFAGVFYGNTFETRQKTYDWKRLNEFWRWWLTEAIPTAWNAEN